MKIQFYKKSQQRRRVKIKFQTVAGVQMQNWFFPVSMENERHVELLVPFTGERVMFAKEEVE